MNERREDIERVWRALLAREAPELLASGDAPALGDLKDSRFAVLLASLLNTQRNETDLALPEMESVSATLRPLLLELQAELTEARLKRWMEQVDRGAESEPLHLEPLPADVESELRSSLERKSLGVDESELRELLTELLDETEKIEDRSSSPPSGAEPVRSQKRRTRIPLQAAVVLFAFVGLGSLYLQFGPSPDVDPVVAGYVLNPSDKGTVPAEGEVSPEVERLSPMALTDELADVRRDRPAPRSLSPSQFGKSKAAGVSAAPPQPDARTAKKRVLEKEIGDLSTLETLGRPARVAAKMELGDAPESKRPDVNRREAVATDPARALEQWNVPIKPLAAVGSSVTKETRARRGRALATERAQTMVEPLRQRELVLQAPLQIRETSSLQDELDRVRWQRRNLDKREAIRSADLRALREIAVGRVPVIICTESPHSRLTRETTSSDEPLAISFERFAALEEVQQAVESNSAIRLVSQEEDSVLIWAEASESSLLDRTFEITEVNVQGLYRAARQLENAFDGIQSDVLIHQAASLESGGDLESSARISEHSYSFKKMRTTPVSVRDYLTYVLNDSPFTAAVRLGRASPEGERRILDEKLPDRGQRKIKVYWIEYTAGSTHSGAPY